VSISDHRFGSQATDLKLSIVEGYLNAFTTALRHKFDELWYIDAFAGTGERTEHFDAQDGNLFDSATPERIERHRGSARIAIDVSPAFDRLIFIEKDPKHCAALEALRFSHPDRRIEIKNGTADDEIRSFLAGKSWSRTRAVMFLDPYGMSVSWETLEQIRKTEAIDVWYLVSLSGMFRQAARDGNALDFSKRAALNRMFGNSDWETQWYNRPEPAADLLGHIDEQYQRKADIDAIEESFGKRLKELFPKVLAPLQLKNTKGVRVFSLFFAISNPKPEAIGLATRIANHMLKTGSSSHVRPR
jgi:three-Cys-motif partner protein